MKSPAIFVPALILGTAGPVGAFSLLPSPGLRCSIAQRATSIYEALALPCSPFALASSFSPTAFPGKLALPGFPPAIQRDAELLARVTLSISSETASSTVSALVEA